MHKVHHHLYHISDVLLNIKRLFSPILLSSSSLSVGTFVHASTRAHRHSYLFYKNTIKPSILIPSLHNVKDELLLNTDAFQYRCRLSL